MVAELMAAMLFHLPPVDVARALLEVSEDKVQRRKNMDQESTFPCRFSAMTALTYSQLVSHPIPPMCLRAAPHHRTVTRRLVVL
jgi:hypothetical protein